jgi:hypothetical protein
VHSCGIEGLRPTGGGRLLYVEEVERGRVVGSWSWSWSREVERRVTRFLVGHAIEALSVLLRGREN